MTVSLPSQINKLALYLLQVLCVVTYTGGSESIPTRVVNSSVTARSRGLQTQHVDGQLNSVKVYAGYMCEVPTIYLPTPSGSTELSQVTISVEALPDLWKLDETHLQTNPSTGGLSGIKLQFIPTNSTPHVGQQGVLCARGVWHQQDSEQGENSVETKLPLVVANKLEFSKLQSQERINLNWGTTVTGLGLLELDAKCAGILDNLIIHVNSRPVELEYMKIYFNEGVLMMSGVMPSSPNPKHKAAARRNALLALTVTDSLTKISSAEIYFYFEIANHETELSSSDLFMVAVLIGFMCLLVVLVVSLGKESTNGTRAVKDLVDPSLVANASQDNNMLSKSVIDWSKNQNSPAQVDQTVVDELYMFKDAQQKEQKKRRSLFQVEDNRPAEIEIPVLQKMSLEVEGSQFNSALKQPTPTLSLTASFMKQTFDLSPIRGEVHKALDLHLETPHRTPHVGTNPTSKSPTEPYTSGSGAQKEVFLPFETPDNKGRVQPRFKQSHTITDFDSKATVPNPPEAQGEGQKAPLHAKSELGMIQLMKTPVTADGKYAQIKRRKLHLKGQPTPETVEGKISFVDTENREILGSGMGGLGSGEGADSHRSAVSVHSHISPRGEPSPVRVSKYEYPSGTAESGAENFKARPSEDGSK